MKFLIDAQLPRRLAYRLREAGHDTLHTLDLPVGNRTQDSELIAIAEREQWIVVTKDADFVTTFWVAHQPSKLLLISTGNITNAELEALFIRVLPDLVDAFMANDFVELGRDFMLFHQ